MAQPRYAQVCSYCIAPNFWVTKFSWISLLQIFAKIKFADQGVQLATPIFGGHMLMFTVLTMPWSAAWEKRKCKSLKHLVMREVMESWFVDQYSGSLLMSPFGWYGSVCTAIYHVTRTVVHSFSIWLPYFSYHLVAQQCYSVQWCRRPWVKLVCSQAPCWSQWCSPVCTDLLCSCLPC